jgi:surface polysaccharide O-acyltransferase-like enzyme
VLFVFLSGFLFQHLAGRHSYPTFLRKRFTTVVLPYLVVCLPAAIASALVPRFGTPYTDITDRSAVYRIVWFLLKGSTALNIALWFVPMIALYYLLAPAFLQIVRRPRLYGLLILLVPLSLLAHRPQLVPHVDTLQASVYFLSAYIAGMWASQYRHRIQPVLSRWWPVLSIGFVLALLAQIVFNTHHGNYDGAHLFSQEHGPVDWVFAERLLECFALLALTCRFSARLEGLRFLGFASFSIYLVHCYYVNGVKLAFLALDLDTGNFASWLFTTVVALALSVLTVIAVRRILGRRSLYVIGSASTPRTGGGPRQVVP